MPTRQSTSTGWPSCTHNTTPTANAWHSQTSLPSGHHYVAAGAERLIVAKVIENEHELDRYRIAVPGAKPVVCRLTASLTLMHEHLRVLEPGMFQDQAHASSTELADILARAAVEDFPVENGPKRQDRRGSA